MKQAYKEINFQKATLGLIDFIDSLIEDYQRQGFTLSVRQLYYQLVARDMIENTERSYKRIASVINDARLAGLLDWDAIEDRNRDIEIRPRWTSGSSLLNACAEQYHMDMWDNQNVRPFVIVEKAALAGVLGPTCRRFDVPLLAARGYPSVSIVRQMVIDHFIPAIDRCQTVQIFHLGDHDPSGIDMTRDLSERIDLFLEDYGSRCQLTRIALSREQIDEQKPPPNPAKTTDSRFMGYRKLHGDESWELDALNPQYITDLVTSHIDQFIDPEEWEARKAEIGTVTAALTKTAADFNKLGL